MDKQLPRDICGGEVDRVLVSQATRNMASGRPDRSLDADAEIKQLVADSEALQARKRQIESQLGVLRGRVVGQGYLPRDEYRAIVDAQTAMKRELGTILETVSKNNLKISRLHGKVEEKTGKSSGEPMSPVLREILAEQRQTNVLLGRIVAEFEKRAKEA